MIEVGWLLQHANQVPSADDWLSPRESAVLAGLRVERRREDWRLGRWTAKCALAAQQGRDADFRGLARFEIIAAADGAPEVRVDGGSLDVSLSLSHRGGIGLCALGPKAHALGCDVELVEPRSAAFVRDWFTEPERQAVACARDSEEMTALLWSAKESALKALRVGLRADTRDVEASVGGPGPSLPWRPLSVRQVHGGAVLSGWWRRAGPVVLTFIAAGPMQAPVELKVVAGAA